MLDDVFDPPALLNTAARWFTYTAAVAGVLGAGWWTTRHHKREGGSGQVA
jgi:hypothetical protein